MARRLQLDALRALLPERPSERPSGALVPSGWSSVDRSIGGLGPGQVAAVEGSPGAGSLALASSWAGHAVRRGEPVVVFDAAGSALPHAWVEPEDARAAIWCVRAGERDLWAGVDLALRSGGFGLVVLLEPPSAPPSASARTLHLLAEHGTRLLVSHWPGRFAPVRATFRIRLAAGTVRWVVGPTGAAPSGREVEVSCARAGTPLPPAHVEPREDVALAGVRAPARAPDRRTRRG